MTHTQLISEMVSVFESRLALFIMYGKARIYAGFSIFSVAPI